MAKIWDNKEHKEVEVKNLKNLRFDSAPGFQFFAHRAYKMKGYAVTEKTTGASVSSGAPKMKTAIEWADSLIDRFGVNGLRKAIQRAMDERSKYE